MNIREIIYEEFKDEISDDTPITIYCIYDRWHNHNFKYDSCEIETSRNKFVSFINIDTEKRPAASELRRDIEDAINTHGIKFSRIIHATLSKIPFLLGDFFLVLPDKDSEKFYYGINPSMVGS